MIWWFVVNFISSIYNVVLMHAPAPSCSPLSCQFQNSSKYVAHCMFCAKYSTIGIYGHFWIGSHNHFSIFEIYRDFWISLHNHFSIFESIVAHNVGRGASHHLCRSLSLSLLPSCCHCCTSCCQCLYVICTIMLHIISVPCYKVLVTWPRGWLLF